MDFFEQQARAHRQTKWLVIYFGAGVAALVAAVYFAAVLLLGWSGHYKRTIFEQRQPPAALWNPQLFAGVAVGTLAVIAIGSIYKTLELSSGGSAMASLMGGRPISPATSDPDERKLLNVVEEMAIASGVPVPQVYVLPTEQGINAFAAGHSNSDAAIAVTRGAMRLLSRDELQGVIGHEFSHILNGDMRLNLRLLGIIFGILCLAVIGRVLLQTRGRKNPLPLFGLALLLIGWIGVFFGRLIQAAVSRQREFLADASSVQFTRNPAGLSGALKKIGGLAYGSRLEAAHASEACHMFFSNGLGESFLHLMDTHPPLRQRILALDPSFDGIFPPVSLAAPSAAEPELVAAGKQRAAFPARMARAGAGLAAVAGPPLLAASQVAGRTGAPTEVHLRYADELRDAIPDSLQRAAREPLGASTLVYAMLLSADPAIRAKQTEGLARTASQPVCEETLRILPELENLPTRARLPLVNLALPGLRDLSPPQFQDFRSAVQMLVESDGEIDLFEYMLQKIVLRHLEPHFTAARKPVIEYYAAKPLTRECAVLLSAMAYAGQADPDQVEFAFSLGAEALAPILQGELGLLKTEECDLTQVDKALDRLSKAVPQIKKNVLNACAQTVAADGVIQELEAELLRAIADTLDCPLPPLVGD